MSLEFHVNLDADPRHVELGTSVARLGAFGALSTKAEASDVGSCSLIFDDPDGTISDNVLPFRQFRVIETDCDDVGADGVNGKLLWIGAINARTFRRGTGPRTSLITGADREVEVVLLDVNGYTNGRIFKGTDGVRPAETDVARITWMMGSGYFPVSDDAGYFDTSNPVDMDATDYLNQTPTDVLHDCALASGKNHFIIPWEATGNATLWYANSDTSTNYSSLLRISNVLSDVDDTTTFAPERDAVLLRDPARVFSTVQVQCPAGTVSAYNATTATDFGARDGSSVTSNVSSLTAATALANRLLDDASTEEDRITCSVQLPSTLATGIKVGQRIRCKFSHLPGYENWMWLRVNSLQIAQDEQTDQRYTLQLEMTPQTAAAGGKWYIALVLVRDLGTHNAVVGWPDGWTIWNEPGSAWMSGDNANGSAYVLSGPSSGEETSFDFIVGGSVPSWATVLEFDGVLGVDAVSTLNQADHYAASSSYTHTAGAASGVLANLYFTAIFATPPVLRSGAGWTQLQLENAGSAEPWAITQWRTFTGAGAQTVEALSGAYNCCVGYYGAVTVSLTAATGITPTLTRQGDNVYGTGTLTVTVST